MRIAKKVDDIVCNDISDIRNGEQFFFACIPDRIKRTKTCRKILGRFVSDVGNAQGKQKSSQFAILALVDSGKDV